MVLRTSVHELHVQLCNSFHVWVSVVLLSAYLHARTRVSEGEFLLVHRTRDDTVIFHTGWLCLFTILLEIVVHSNQCFGLLSMFVLLFEIERYW
jgi:hypothetical protein